MYKCASLLLGLNLIHIFTYLAGGIENSLPEIFPWLKYIQTQVTAPAMIPSDIVDHDNCYCSLDIQLPFIVLHPG